MDTRLDTVARILQLCGERNMAPYQLGTKSGVPQSTIKNILNGTSKNPGIVTIKKLCDGFEIPLSEFFNTETFRDLEQEIK